MTGYLAFPSDGFAVRWTSGDGAHGEDLILSWENEAWTATGSVSRENVDYVIRLSPLWQVRQFLLFRDLAEPDLWLGTDGRGRWGEMNGAHRPDLDGAFDVALAITPFTHSLPIRRLPLAVGDRADVQVLDIDVETLGVVTRTRRYERIARHRWAVEEPGDRPGRLERVEFEVDVHGLPLDLAPTFHRA